MNFEDENEWLRNSGNAMMEDIHPIFRAAGRLFMMASSEDFWQFQDIREVRRCIVDLCEKMGY